MLAPNGKAPTIPIPRTQQRVLHLGKAGTPTRMPRVETLRKPTLSNCRTILPVRNPPLKLSTLSVSLLSSSASPDRFKSAIKILDSQHANSRQCKGHLREIAALSLQGPSAALKAQS